MITGAQIRASLKLLGWSALDLSERTRITAGTVIRAEASDGTASISLVQENAIRRALIAAGIEFVAENDGGAGVRLGTARKDTRTESRRKADVIVGYLHALQGKLGALRSGDTETIQGTDAISILFPPGVASGDLDPRAEAIIGTFAESYGCDYDYEPHQGKLRFIKR
jgi:transcriptional regulator with XRE-family HTH domain